MMTMFNRNIETSNGPSSLSGVQKASLLLMTLGAAASADVFQYLTDSEIELLASEIEQMPDFGADLQGEVVAEFELERAMISAADLKEEWID